MPVAGDEGFEKTVICPYDRAHEVRLGRMQIHLKKCRENYPNSVNELCPYNSNHRIPKMEMGFHTAEECPDRINWDRHTHDIGDTNCPVRNLVPVTAGFVPDGEENWDDYEAKGSVLNNIKTQVTEKEVFRLMQCKSKSKRKKFREEERLRHTQLKENALVTFPKPRTDESEYSTSNPLRRPTIGLPLVMEVVRQDPNAAIANIDEQFRTLDLNMKPGTSYAPSECSSLDNAPPSLIDSIVAECASTSRANSSCTYDKTPSISMSSALSYTSSRPSTAMSIAASVNRLASSNAHPEEINYALSEEGFSLIPIPGRGRGVAAKNRARE